MSTNTKEQQVFRQESRDKLAEALAQYEAALLFAYPEGARGAAFDCWNKARQALAAHEAKQALPLKDRPDFIAGYDAGLKDGRRCAERDSAEQAAKAVPAGLYVGLIERLMKLSTRLGIAYEGGVEHFAASLEDRLYAICRSAEGLLDSLAAAPTPPAPEAQQAAGQAQDERAAFEAWARTYSTLPITHDAMFPHSYEDMGQAMLWDAWQARAALAQRREPLTDEDWRTRDSSDTDEGCAALHRAHGIGTTTGEQR